MEANEASGLDTIRLRACRIRRSKRDAPERHALDSCETSADSTYRYIRLGADLCQIDFQASMKLLKQVREVVKSKYSNVLKPWMMSSMPPNGFGKTLRVNSGHVALCYVRFECSSLDSNSARNHDWIQTDPVL
jgi:hypothetical protein